MAQYLVLIYGDPTYEAGSDDDVMKGHVRFGEEHGAKLAGGHALQPAATATSIRPDGAGFTVTDGPFLETKEVLGGSALQPTSTATVVRADGAGSYTVTDGPFAEAKEAIGGYYLVEATDLDEAIEMAKDVPTPYGCIEVRPIMVFE
jgi:hypothetical protein